MKTSNPNLIEERLDTVQAVLSHLRQAAVEGAAAAVPVASDTAVIPWHELEARVEAQCLFPALEPAQRQLLALLGWQHQLLGHLIHMDRARIHPGFRPQWEATTNEIERQYMRLVSLIKAEVGFDTWPEADRQLFLRRYLWIPVAGQL